MAATVVMEVVVEEEVNQMIDYLVMVVMVVTVEMVQMEAMELWLQSMFIRLQAMLEIKLK